MCNNGAVWAGCWHIVMDLGGDSSNNQPCFFEKADNLWEGNASFKNCFGGASCPWKLCGISNYAGALC